MNTTDICLGGKVRVIVEQPSLRVTHCQCLMYLRAYKYSVHNLVRDKPRRAPLLGAVRSSFDRTSSRLLTQPFLAAPTKQARKRLIRSEQVRTCAGLAI